MRINSGISDELMLMAVPGDQLDSLAESPTRVTETHSVMEAHYNERAASSNG